VRVGILADKNVETLSKQLLQCKATLDTAMRTMTLSVYLNIYRILALTYVQTYEHTIARGDVGNPDDLADPGRHVEARGGQH
jgi:hypothetical protein